MKKSRIIRALKKYDSEDLKKHKLCRFEDEKGNNYFLGEEKMYMTIITDAINTTLQKVFPYAKVRQFTDDEMSIYESVLPRIKGTISGADQSTLVKLYNKVFNANKKPSSCGSCVQQTVAKLAKVYVNSCKVNNDESDI
jgi:hypothetical protein